MAETPQRSRHCASPLGFSSCSLASTKSSRAGFTLRRGFEGWIEASSPRALLQPAVEELPDIYRQVFLLRDVEEMNINETAEALSISIPSVKVRLHRARMMLQKQLAPQLRTATRTSKRRSFPWS